MKTTRRTTETIGAGVEIRENGIGTMPVTEYEHGAGVVRHYTAPCSLCAADTWIEVSDRAGSYLCEECEPEVD